MRVLDRIDVVRKELDEVRASGRTVGFVPTMGALHEGHLSLVRRSAQERDVTLVSVFVNPLQFGPSEDFARYPRSLERDVAAAEGAGAALVFAPSVDEMYPEPVVTRVTVGGLGQGLEEASRPGHFAGVGTVVAKLFGITAPCRAYFGEKDYQQLQVVSRLAADLSFPVEVVGCATVREADGVALSSRNTYLSSEERAAATVLNRALTAAAEAAAAGECDAGRLRAIMAEVVSAEPLARLDYAEVADPSTLRPLERLQGEARLLVAAWLGTTRLIDNMTATARAA